MSTRLLRMMIDVLSNLNLLNNNLLNYFVITTKTTKEEANLKSTSHISSSNGLHCQPPENAIYLFVCLFRSSKYRYNEAYTICNNELE